MGTKTGRLLLLLSVVVSLAGLHMAYADDPAIILETLLRGVEHRASALQLVVCEARVFIGYGGSAADMLPGPSVLPPGMALPEPMDTPRPVVADVRYLVDSQANKWLFEQVPLEMDRPSPPSPPPAWFYQRYASDGINVSQYSRSTQQATLRPLDPVRGLSGVPSPALSQLQSGVIYGLPDRTIRSWRNGECRVQYLGTSELDGRACHEVCLWEEHGEVVSATLVAISPDLGFASVRRTSVNFTSGGTRDEMVPDQVYHTVCGPEFFPIADRLWCARNMDRDSFDLTLDTLEAGWKMSRRYIISRVAIGAAAEAFIQPEFPLGVAVQDWAVRELPVLVAPPPEAVEIIPRYPEETVARIRLIVLGHAPGAEAN